jgi:anti-sigma regulatory factor (Ser/Thr protein kinase)
MKSVVPGLVTAMPDLEANRLELRGELSELRRLAEWIKTRALQVIAADTLFAVQLCLEEAVANIIMHGGEKDDRLKIAIELERNGRTLEQISLGSNREDSQYLINERVCRH